MRICNFHADTPCRLHSLGIPFEHEHLEAGAYAHLPYRFAFETYAFFSEKSLTDEDAWQAFHLRLIHFQSAVLRSPLPAPSYVLSVEDARLLAGKIERVAELREIGVRIMTLVWRGESIIGGAYDTSSGLTSFGKSVVEECFRVGIVPDISHASDRLSDEVYEIACSYHKPILASHSNFRSICNIRRNQNDKQYLKIASLGGVSGISMCPEHISTAENPSIPELLKHIEHGLSLDPRALVFGTDFDGIQSTPDKLQNTASLVALADRLLSLGYNESTVNGLFFGNGIRFLKQAMPDLHFEL